MTRADIGIAVGAGTDIAMEAAGIVLVKSDIFDVVHARFMWLHISTHRNEFVLFVGVQRTRYTHCSRFIIPVRKSSVTSRSRWLSDGVEFRLCRHVEFDVEEIQAMQRGRV